MFFYPIRSEINPYSDTDCFQNKQLVRIHQSNQLYSSTTCTSTCTCPHRTVARYTCTLYLIIMMTICVNWSNDNHPHKVKAYKLWSIKLSSILYNQIVNLWTQWTNSNSNNDINVAFFRHQSQGDCLVLFTDGLLDQSLNHHQSGIHWVRNYYFCEPESWHLLYPSLPETYHSYIWITPHMVYINIRGYHTYYQNHHGHNFSFSVLSSSITPAINLFSSQIPGFTLIIYPLISDWILVSILFHFWCVNDQIQHHSSQI